jgi:unsaturated chondroitin disaccharide hydrolase
MFQFNKIIITLGFTMLCIACKSKFVDGKSSNNFDANALLQKRYQKLLDYPVDSVSFPRSMTPTTGKIKKVPSKDWTCGFFAGNLWQLYTITGNPKYIEKSKQWTAFIEKEKFNNRTHDMGFKVFCSFGEGLAIEDNQHYKDVIVKSAQTLSTRYNKKVHAIRSWDFNKEVWEYPVIIDNMLNLELLFEASKISGDNKYRDIAIEHANTTLKNHFRPDNSCYHVVSYDTITGQPKMKVTHQGFNNESSWARGQGWAIYGYTMCYRYTKDPAYLKQAEATAQYFINNKNLPEDGIPYWDFKDPSIPKAPRDVSAGSLVASGLIELYTYTKNQKYLDYSNKVLKSLQTQNYILKENIDGPFILDHCTGNWPAKDEIDEPIVYGDYYFLEALLRKKDLKN